jgi:deoxycytidylate deaminase
VKDPEKWLAQAAKCAGRALCLRANCGAVLVKDDRILGAGYNGPPKDDLDLRVCTSIQASKNKPKSDRTCCMHAEWRALDNGLVLSPRDVEGSTMVFCRVDAAGNLLKSGNPYCTVCSRLTLDRGVGSWILWHETGIREYSAREYHQLSERYDDLTE